eukprot:SAG31_NODE_2288_length_6003_cov_1.876355_3_plen_355_part_00
MSRFFAIRGIAGIQHRSGESETQIAWKDARGTTYATTGERLIGPGSNTSVSTAALLSAAALLQKYGRFGDRNECVPERSLVFAAVSQEETGMHGMKALYEEYQHSADAFIDVLGDGHTITFGALSIRWWQIIASGTAAHTLRGGLPHVNQAIGRAVDRILSLPEAANTWTDTPADRASRTRINVAMVQSGSVFNHRPASGWFSLDIRSMEEDVCSEIEAKVDAILRAVSAETGVQMRMKLKQLTPGGQVLGAESSLLVAAASAISQLMDIDPTVSNFGSSNTNVSVAGGTLSICIGGRPGSDARGTLDEFCDVDALMRTVKQVYMLAASLGSSAHLNARAHLMDQASTAPQHRL